MAQDTEQLVLSISADVKQMQRALNRVISDSQKTTAAVVKHFNGMSSSTEGAFEKTAAASGRAASQIAANQNRIAAAMKVSQFQTANVAAQLNDIGVQLAAGTSPFQIAIQQGTQLNQVLGQRGVRGAVGALGGAVASLVNPVSLATIAFIGLGGVAVQYFADVVSDGKDSEEQLKKERDLIQQVAKDWGDALPALKAYADELERLEKIRQRDEATAASEEQIWQPAREAVQGLIVDMVEAYETLRLMGGSVSEITDLQGAFVDLQNKVDEQKATSEDALKVVELLEQSGVPAVAALTDQFQTLADTINVAALRAGELQSENERLKESRDLGPYSNSRTETAQALRAGEDFIAEQQRLNSLTAEQLALEAEIARIKKEASDEGAVINAEDAKRLAEERLAAEQGRKDAAKISSSSAKEAEREREAVAKLIDELAFELSLIGLSNEEKRVAIELRKAGAAATEEQKEKIATLIPLIEQEKDALEQSQEAMDQLQSVAKDVLGGFLSDLREGKDASEALASALDKVIDKLLEMALNQTISNLFGGGSGGGGILGSLLGGFSSGPSAQLAASGGVGLFAKGGISNRPAIFGESGPEAAVPLPDGRRIPVDLRLPAMTSAAESRTRLAVDLSPDLEARVLEKAGRQSVEIVTRASPSIVSAATGQTAKSFAKGDMDPIMRGRYGTRPTVTRRGG